ncbi:hypothetical protein C1I95_21785 [Micromonospora craterilacus]|uniref:Uncharacterized protein n=1 Tax=Micromonospora craterilacus TaxID=1655439 RepID=A0A2W2EBH4_9ACTN|nr:hypothetical protein [Micromonospora craterilacus]PZG14425.1 hypothetical protein C1I95_21785 [Micromonospora craterilacus]
MRIEMKTLYATPARSIAAGATADLPDDEAQELIDKGFAIPVDDEDERPRRPSGRAAASGRKASGGRSRTSGRNSKTTQDPDPDPDPDRDPDPDPDGGGE